VEPLGIGILGDETVDLVVEVLELALAEAQELQEDADLVLVGILLLQRTCLALKLVELVLEVVSELRSQVGLVELVLELGSLLNTVFQLEYDLETEGQVLGVQGVSLEVGGDHADQLILELVGTLGLGLVA
jgi:hypothetical protein